MSGFPGRGRNGRASAPVTAPVTRTTGTTGRGPGRVVRPAGVGGRTAAATRRFVHNPADIRILLITPAERSKKPGFQGRSRVSKQSTPRGGPRRYRRTTVPLSTRTTLMPRVLVAPAPLREIEHTYEPTLTAAGYQVEYPPRRDFLTEV